MSDISSAQEILRELVRSLLPRGTAWNAAPDSWFSKFIDGIGDSVENVYEKLKKLGSTRDPDATDILEELEREYGVIPLSRLEDSERRSILAGRVYSKPGMGVDDLEARLAKAGFKDLTTGDPVRVWRNEERENPNYYLGGEYACVCGYETSVCGNPEAFCGLDGVGGKLLVNRSSEYSEEKHSVPQTDGHWNIVFFVGGDRNENEVGFVVLEDGDMEAADTSAWTAGNGATLSKDATTQAEGAQSLKIEKSNDYVKQDISKLIENDADVARSFWMDDNGDGIFRWRQRGADTLQSSDGGENGVSHTNPAFDPGTNSADPTQVHVDFDKTQGGEASIAGAGDEANSYGQWVKVNDASPDPYFRVQPKASGYANLPHDITVDGVTLSPVVRYEAKDASSSAWNAVVGDDLVTASTGDDPTVDELSPGLTDKRTQYYAGKVHEGSDNTVGQIGTDDVIFEAIIKAPDVLETTDYLGKYDSADYTLLLQMGGGDVRWYLRSTAGNSVFASSPDLVAGKWHHLIGFAKRDEDMVVYANGVPGSSVDTTTLQGQDVAMSGVWELGGIQALARKSEGSIAYFAMWTDDTGAMTNEQQTQLARSRALMAMGCNPTVFQTLNNPKQALDLDMEEAGVSNWSATDATLSKESGSPSGSGSQVLRVTTTTASSDIAASQTAFTTGFSYRVQGWARADGVTTAYPSITRGDLTTANDFVWEGTASNTWQYFDVHLTTAGTPLQLVGRSAGDAGAWVEFDDIVITQSGDSCELFSRNKESYVEKWDSTETEAYLIPVGVDWIPTDKYKTQSGGFENGVWVGDSMNNEFHYSNDFTNGVWTTQDLSVTPDDFTALGEISFSRFTAGLGTETVHSIEQTVSTLSSANPYGVSVYVHAGSLQGVMLENSNDPNNQFAVFDLVNGVVGETGTGLSQDQGAFIEDKGNGVYRCSVFFDADATTQTFTLFLTDGPNASDKFFTSDGSSDYIYASSFQMTDPSYIAVKKYIETTNSAYTGSITDLHFTGMENCDGVEGAQKLITRQSYILMGGESSNTGFGLYTISLDGSNNDSITGYSSTAAGALVHRFRARQSSINLASLIGSDPVQDHMGELQQAEDFIDTSNARTHVERSLDKSGALSAPFVKTLNTIQLGESGAVGGDLDGYITSFEIGKHGLDAPRAISAIYELDEDLVSMIGYDELIPGSGQYELRGYTDSSGDVSYNYGTFNEGDWHHVSLAREGGDSKLYVDGAEVESHSETQSTALARKLSMGWAPHTGWDDTDSTKDYTVATGDVSISEPYVWGANPPPLEWYQEIYNRGRTTIDANLVHEISPHQTVLDNEDLDTEYYDFIGGLVGVASWVDGDPTQQRVAEGGFAVHSDNQPAANDNTTDLEIDFGSGSEFMQSLDHTYSGWVKQTSVGGYQILWTNKHSGDNDQTIYVDNGVLTYRCVVNGVDVEVSETLAASKLQHVAVTREHRDEGGASFTTYLNLYIDGELVDSNSESGSPAVTEDSLKLYNTEFGSDYFYGLSLQNRFYNTFLSASEINDIYNEGLTVIYETGAYATQAIESTDKAFSFSGWTLSNVDEGFALVQYRREAGENWETLFFVEEENLGVWHKFTESIPGMYEFRIVAKSFNKSGGYSVNYDDLDGGEDPGTDTTVQRIKIPLSQKEAFEELILRRKPLHSWATLVVEYVSSE